MCEQVECSNREQLVATAAELQEMADLIEKYPAEAQLVMAALEDGLRVGPMRVAGDVASESGSGSAVR